MYEGVVTSLMDQDNEVDYMAYGLRQRGRERALGLKKC